MTANNEQLPSWLRFRDEESERNFGLAMAGDVNEFGFRPMVAINAPAPGIGKTWLARHILGSRYGSARTCLPPSTERQWERMLCACQVDGYLFVDDVPAPLVSDRLARFLTAKKWQSPWLEDGETVMLDVDVQVVVAGNHLRLSDDLSRRSIWIHLAGEGLKSRR